MSKRWRTRVASALVLVAAGWIATRLMDFDPQPVQWVLLASLACAVAWLVIDATDIGAAQWDPPPATGEDRVEVTTPEQRVLDNHLASPQPGSALRERLIALARTRDPALHDPLLRAVAEDPAPRLSADEIARILTRIEDLRDR